MSRVLTDFLFSLAVEKNSWHVPQLRMTWVFLNPRHVSTMKQVSLETLTEIASNNTRCVNGEVKSSLRTQGLFFYLEPILMSSTWAIPTLAKRSTKFGQHQVWPDFVFKVERGLRGPGGPGRGVGLVRVGVRVRAVPVLAGPGEVRAVRVGGGPAKVGGEAKPRKKGSPKGWGSKTQKNGAPNGCVAPRGGGPEGWEPEGWEPEGWAPKGGGPKISHFFFSLSRHNFIPFRAFKNTTKIPREDPTEEEKKNENCGGRGKQKKRIFWAALRRAVRERGIRWGRRRGSGGGGSGRPGSRRGLPCGGGLSLITSVETPCQEHTDALYCCCSCKATFIAVSSS